MENMRHRLSNYRKNFILHYVIPFCLLLCACMLVGLMVIQEQRKLMEEQREIENADLKRIEIEQQISQLEQELDNLNGGIIQDSGWQSQIIFCFTEFEDSSYRGVIRTLEQYGYPGVIVFDGTNLPGMPGCISIEEYQELIAKGWEGAIETEAGNMLYQYMADPVVDKWKSYMEETMAYFEHQDMQPPTTYVLQEGEMVDSVLPYFSDYGITFYATVETNTNNAQNDLNMEPVVQMAMKKAPYYYTELESELNTLEEQGTSIALRFLEVEGSAPWDERHSSVYRLNQYCETIQEYGLVKVGTFQSYQKDWQSLMDRNSELISEYKAKKEAIEEKIRKLQGENIQNFWNAISYK